MRMCIVYIHTYVSIYNICRERERENSHYGNQSGWNIHQFDEISQRQKPPWGVPSHVSWDPHGNRSGTEPSFLRLTVFKGVHRWKDCSIWYSNVLLQNAVAFQQEIQLVFPQFSLHHFGKRKKPCMCQHIPKPTILDYIGLDIQVSTVHLYILDKNGYIIGYSMVGKPVSQTLSTISIPDFQWYHPWGIFQQKRRTRMRLSRWAILRQRAGEPQKLG